MTNDANDDSATIEAVGPPPIALTVGFLRRALDEFPDDAPVHIGIEQAGGPRQRWPELLVTAVDFELRPGRGGALRLALWAEHPEAD